MTRIDEIRAALADRERERRIVSGRAELRANDDGGFKFEGHAAVFDKRSEDLGFFRPVFEVIKRGAFKDALKTSDVRFLINHNPDLLLARNTSGTLELREDPTGLLSIADVPPVSYAEDLRLLLDRGDISQMSFAFAMGPGSEQSLAEEDDGTVIRTIVKVSELFDVSVVTYPAYPDTDAGAREHIAGTDVHDPAALRDLAWRVHRGEITITVEERHRIDALLEQASTVSPWTAERTFLAVASEPELLAAVPGKRAHVELQATNGDEPAFRLANAQRRLRQRARFVR